MIWPSVDLVDLSMLKDGNTAADAVAASEDLMKLRREFAGNGFITGYKLVSSLSY